MIGCSYNTLIGFMTYGTNIRLWAECVVKDDYGGKDHKSYAEFRRIQDLFLLAQEVLDELGD